MYLIQAFDRECHLEGCSIRITTPVSGRPVVTLYGKRVEATPVQATLLAIMIQSAEEGLTIQEFAGLRGRSIETGEAYQATINTLKVQISHIRLKLKKAAPDDALPALTSLYGRSENSRNAVSGVSQQAYILTAPISGKPDYHKTGLTIAKSDWERHVDVLPLGDEDGNLRIYKRRIRGWENGIVFVGDKVIPMNRLQTAALAQTIASQAPPLYPRNSGRLVFTVPAAENTGKERDFSSQDYQKLISQVVQLIDGATGKTSVSAQVAELTSRPLNAPSDIRPPTIG